jgi:isoquinoline 1-oxidoreductase beta subunit
MRVLGATKTGALSRRDFLHAGAAAGGGLLIGWSANTHAQGAAANFAPDAFVRIDRAGKVTVISPMIEMGQGTYTSLPMLVAEDLDVEMSSVSVEHAPPSDKLYGNAAGGGAQVTGGSASIRGFFLPLRQAGAAARLMLMAAAAKSLDVDIAS